MPVFFIIFFIITGCQRSDRSAYFGGKVENPGTPYVYLFRDYIPARPDSFRLDASHRFGGFIRVDKPGAYLALVDGHVIDVYLRPGDSLVMICNTLDFENSVNFSGSEVADFNNMLRDLGNINMEEIRNILPLLKEYSSNVIVNFVNMYRDKKKRIVNLFEDNHPRWRMTPLEKEITDLIFYTPDLFLFERFNEFNRGKDTIHYEIPFDFDPKKRHPVSFMLHYWLTYRLLNKYPGVDFNDMNQIKNLLGKMDSIFGDPVLADIEKYKMIQHYIGDLYPSADTNVLKDLSDYTGSIFTDSARAAFTARYINMFYRNSKGQTPENLKLLHGANCDTSYLYDLLEKDHKPYILIMTHKKLDPECYGFYKKLESFRSKFRDSLAIYYMYEEPPSVLEKQSIQFNPEYFYRLSPESNYFGLYNTIYFKKPRIYIFDRNKKILLIINPCKENFEKKLDSLLTVSHS